MNLWPNLTGGEVIDLLRPAARRYSTRPRRAELLERFELDPTKKGRSLLQGQPAEGRAGRRARLRRRAAGARRADVRAGPADGVGLPRLRRRVPAPTGTTVLLSSHILAEVERLCDRVSIIRAGRCVETGTLAELRHLTRTSITADLVERCRTGWRDCPACTTSRSRTHRVQLEVDTDRARRGARTRCSRPGSRSLHQPAADARGAVPPPLRRPDRPGEEVSRGDRHLGCSCARSCAATAGCYLWWGLGVALLYVSQAWSVDGLYTTQAEFDTRPRRAWRATPRSSPWPARPGR